MIRKKKEFYDKYGTEEEFRAKYQHQQNNHHYEEDLDPFDLFNMFFGGGMNGEFVHHRRGNRVFMRRRQNDDQNNEQNQPQRGRWGVLLQLLPLFLIMFSSVISGFFKSTPIYSFTPSEDYYKKMSSHINKVHYYVGDKFINKYKSPDEVIEFEYQVEREYIDYLITTCNNALKTKQELEYKLYYYSRSQHGLTIQKEINKLDFSSCNKYNEIKNRFK